MSASGVLELEVHATASSSALLILKKFWIKKAGGRTGCV